MLVRRLNQEEDVVKQLPLPSSCTESNISEGQKKKVIFVHVSCSPADVPRSPVLCRFVVVPFQCARFSL